MRDLIHDLRLAVKPENPEPDPRERPMAWAKWFSELYGVDLHTACHACGRRKAEWDAMEAATAKR